MLLKSGMTLFAILLAIAIAGLCAPQALAQATQPAQQPEDVEADREFVKLETTKGDIVLELNREKAPITVKNFLTYTHDEFYDGTIFHRVIPNFMIQGGGFTREMKQKETRDPIKNEWKNGLKNERGTIAMARTANPDSATAQFFINVKDNEQLDQPISGGAAYAVFGKVIAGMDVVEKIKEVRTTTHGQHRDVPAEPVIIAKAREISKADAERAVAREKSNDDADSNDDGDDTENGSR